MIFGNLAPVVKLLNDNGALVESITLPQPNRRSDQPYRAEHQDAENVFGEVIRLKHRYRYHDTLTFLDMANNDVEAVMRIARHKEVIRLFPWGGSIISEPVLVSDCAIGPHNGIINYDDVEIEFIGKQQKERIPNPDTMLLMSSNRIII